MALRTILTQGDETLTKKCRPVTAFDDRLATLLDDMTETLLHLGCVGGTPGRRGPAVGRPC